jgi:hypothetical protein
MILSSKCAPTLIFIGISLIQIIVDIYKGSTNNAFIKFIVMIVLSLVINILCDIGLSLIAWFLVFTPIIMMTLISTLLFRVIGSSPDKKLETVKPEIQMNDINDGGNLDKAEENINNVERLDRNKHRQDFYDKIDFIFELKKTGDYDLSNNPIKYNIADNLLNKFGDNFFNYKVAIFNRTE